MVSGPPTLMDWLERVDNTAIAKGPLRLPIQYVLRPNLDYRGYVGRIASGSIAPGNRVKILPSGVETVIEEITSMDAALDSAEEGASRCGNAQR